MPSNAVRFADLVEMIDTLPLEDRESLVEVVRKRNADEERHRIAASIRAAKREHSRGQCKPVTPAELMREILG
jgi:hypothetical protein